MTRSRGPAQTGAVAELPPETKYARLGEDRIAYQVIGDGPVDLLYAPARSECLDLRFDWPPLAEFLRRVSSFTRLIMFDRRGTGASDALSYEGLSLWEQWADDARAVLDAVGSERAAILGTGDAGPTAVLFAATEPERTRALILFTTSSRFAAADDYPWGPPEEAMEPGMQLLAATWGTDAPVDLLVPSMAGDAAFRRWYAKTSRLAMTPRDAARYFSLLYRMDVRLVLPSVRVPTLVMHRTDFQLPVEQGRYLADHIPGARFVTVPGIDSLIYTAPTAVILAGIEEFLTGARPVMEPDRVLAAVLYTDIVGSTERAASMGDRRWKELLRSHHAVGRSVVEQHRGRLVKTTGDGVLATFDGPGRAIVCALALRDALATLGLEVRTGLHTGEVELIDEDIGGIGVHVAARVLDHAGPGEVLTSAAVPLLVAGSGVEFEDRGEHELKGVPGKWRLFAVKGLAPIG
jgi:class 3 adenylate cyclase